jgi:hypothetical protein
MVSALAAAKAETIRPLMAETIRPLMVWRDGRDHHAKAETRQTIPARGQEGTR